jgi:hypothetical protein
VARKGVNGIDYYFAAREVDLEADTDNDGNQNESLGEDDDLN